MTEWTPADEYDRRQGRRAYYIERKVANLLLGCLLLQFIGLVPVISCLLKEGMIDPAFFAFDVSASNAGQRQIVHSVYAALFSLAVGVSATAAIIALRSWDIVEPHWLLAAVGMWIVVCAECLAMGFGFYINW